MGSDLPAAIPYRHMDLYEEPTVAERMREKTDKSLSDAFDKRVSDLLTRIEHRASAGNSEVSWPDSHFTRKVACEEIAAVLEDRGFTCVVRTHESAIRWWRSPDPEESIWEVIVTW